MSLLIPDPTSSGREIDVYLQPLIEELKELWNFGVIDRHSGYKVEYLSWDIDAIREPHEQNDDTILDDEVIGIMSSFSSSFDETDAMFLEFVENKITPWGNPEPTRLLDRSSLTSIVVGRSRFYNDSTSSLSNQSQPILEGSQPFSEDEICEMILGRRLGYLKGLGCEPKPKFSKMVSGSNASTLCLQFTKDLQLRIELDEAKRVIEE
ncbi:uncharacterized protein E5676_scaffold322G00190 [Cucumis melo var. makuwa]|uniref:Uncharacterized protein n=1 Tax=Cucumis melo var. makuwa TaxID=1194695 RepID=A0A5A7T853_CUCMM|nr:uncharacterized protein E6C27_scaffold121G00530 [Cucumis melo var. makuwa]TYK26958.1 uncharacterized protein E5676_scaffold322G00190 [Cucumis melo var. makuwa]